MPTIVRDGTTLAYEERGSGGPAFVFVHGWTCNRSFFKPQADYFAARHRVVSLDLRGHGDSDKPQGAYPISAYADDIAFLIDKLSLGRVIAVGHRKAPALHIAATPPLNPPHLMSEWMPAVINGWTVGAGHFNMLEAPAQVNGMIEGFLRHHV